MEKEVLIIEDDLFILDTISMKFTQSGFKVSPAINAEQAEAILAKSTPSIILLDLILPTVSGFDILKRIKSDPIKKLIPVIIFSNLDSKEDIDRAMELGAAGYMVKADFTPSEVVKKVEKLLSK